MTYELGAKSLRELEGVDERLVEIVSYAILHTKVDFSVHDGLRTEAEQRENVARGVSKTMKSKHLEGRAVDLVPYIEGKLRWEWEPIYQVASAVQRAGQVTGTRIRWGGVWDRELNALSLDLEKEVEQYVQRTRSLGRKVFLDGPHFELL